MDPKELAYELAKQKFAPEDVEDYRAIAEMEQEMENLDNRYRKIANFIETILPVLARAAAKGLLA